MDTDIPRSIFDKARDRYDQAKKITFFSILALFLFHITTFQPFIDASSRLAQVDAENETLISVQPKLVAIQGDLESLEKRTSDVIESALAQTMMLKLADFHQLNERVVRIRQGDSVIPPAPIAPPDMPHMQLRDEPIQMQMQAATPNLAPQGMPDTRPGFRVLPAIEDATAERIKQTNSVVDLRALLLPYVQKNIIEFRFAELNERLQSQTQSLKASATKLRDKANQYSKTLAFQTAYFQSVGEDLGRFVQALDTLSIQPPDNDRWWTTVQSKMATVDALAADAESSLGKHLNTQLSNQLLSDLQTAIQHNETVKADIDAEIKALEMQFESQQAQFQKMASSMNWGALNLKPVTATFPVLLALILAALSVMLSRRIHELSAAIHLMPEGQHELWDWLRRRVDMTGDTMFFDKVMSKDSMISLGSLGWVAIASWQVADWVDVGTNRAALMYALSVPLIAFAVWYRKRVLEGLARED